MATDIDLPVTGRDVSIILLVNGEIEEIIDMVTSFNSDGVYDRVETKVVGTAETFIDDVLVGWEGSMELAESRVTPQEVMDLVHNFQRNRLPLLVNIREQINYRDGSQKQYTYPDVKLQTSTRNRRAEVRGTTLNFKTGKDRIAA